MKNYFRKEVQKGGAGKHNWGTVEDELYFFFSFLLKKKFKIMSS